LKDFDAAAPQPKYIFLDILQPIVSVAVVQALAQQAFGPGE